MTFLLFWTAKSQDHIRAEIEEAARDSALLAEELAAMLAKLEEDDQEDPDTVSLVTSELGMIGSVGNHVRFKVVLERALETTEELSRIGKSDDTDLPRKPKQGFGFVEKLLDVLEDTPAFSEDFQESGLRLEEAGEEERSSGLVTNTSLPYHGKNEKEEEEEEKCEDMTASDKVRVCVPGFDVKSRNLYFGGEETYEEDYCYTK